MDDCVNYINSMDDDLICVGVWIMHCHLDVHIAWGLATILLVEDGVGLLQSIESPPEDLPLC